MSRRIIGWVVFIAAGVFCGYNVLHENGMVGQTKKPLVAPIFVVKGCFCHSDTPSVATTVWIEGPETLAAGQQALYTINVAKDSNIAAGFDVAAFFGDLGVVDSIETQLMRVDESNPVDSLELTHTSPKLADGRDTISWQFYYRAPLVSGIVDTIYANGNSVDLSFDPTGDYWNFAPNFLVRIIPPVGVAEGPLVRSFSLSQNYPNPFNPSTVIQFSLPVRGQVRLEVFDVSGRRVSTLVDESLEPGHHQRTFLPSPTLASGVYFYRITVQSDGGERGEVFSTTKKMLVMK